MVENPTNFSAVEVSDAVGVRVAEFLRRELGRHAVKRMQTAFGIAQSTAEKILAGKRPENRLFDRLVLDYGRRFLNFIYEPLIPEPVRRIEEEMHLLGAIQARLEEERNAMARALADRLAHGRVGQVDARGRPGNDKGA